MMPSPAEQRRTVPPTEPRGERDTEPRGERLVALLLLGSFFVLVGLAALVVALFTVVGTT